MNNETIGTNAGLVWNALNANNGQTIKDLKKATKIKTDKVLFSALGWLAREGKLAFAAKDEEIVVALA